MIVKIAYLIGNFPLLSETFVASEVDRLKRLGMDISIFAFSKPPEDDIGKLNESSLKLMEETTYISNVDAIKALILHPLMSIRAWRDCREIINAATGNANKLIALSRAVALSGYLKKEGIDHLHAHWPYATQVAHLVHVLTGIPYSVSIHAHEVAHENGHFPIAFKTLSFAAFCNRGAMEYLLKQLPPEARNRAHLIYHGVDVDRFPALDVPSQKKPLSIITAGRLTKTKGFDRLIRACSEARSQGVDVRLTILGRGALEEELRRVADEAGFAEYLSLPGWVSHDQVRDFMVDSHVFALMADTSFHDGLPNVALEAMASGRPVILSPLPAAPEAVTDGVEGFILDDANDVEGFVSVVTRLQQEDGLCEKMGVAARERVVRDHDADGQIRVMMDFFENREGRS